MHRNQLFIYLNAIVVLLLTFAASYLSSKIDNKTLSSLIDPTGLTAITKTTELWTVTERNQQLIPLNWLIVVNRVLWLGVGIAILLFTYARFSFTFEVKETECSVERKDVRMCLNQQQSFLPLSAALLFVLLQQIKSVSFFTGLQ